MKKTIAAAALVTVTACAPITPLPQPQGGYNAIHFRQATQIRDHSVNLYTFTAGTVLIQDRVSAAGPVYCGPVVINDDSRISQGCFGLKGNSTLIIGPDSWKRVERAVPPGSIEIIKQRL